MKKLAVLIPCLALIWIPALPAQETKTNAPARIAAGEAKQHIDSEATVFGKVSELHKTEKLVLINFDRRFPNQPFTAVVYANKTNLFSDLEKLKGKTVEVTGRIREYHEQPQIILLSTNQLNILDAVTEPEKK